MPNGEETGFAPINFQSVKTFGLCTWKAVPHTNSDAENRASEQQGKNTT